MNYTEMLLNRDERLVNLLNQADSKNLELIEEINKKDKEIDRLNKLLDETRLSELHKEYIINELEKWIYQQILDTESCEVFEAKAYNNQLVEVYNRDKRQYKMILDKLKALKENNNV